MTDGAQPPLYSVDSSAFMDWQARFYPVDVFASIVARVDTLIAANRFVAPALVKEEIGIVGTLTPQHAGWPTWTAAALWPTTSRRR